MAKAAPWGGAPWPSNLTWIINEGLNNTREQRDPLAT